MDIGIDSFAASGAARGPSGGDGTGQEDPAGDLSARRDAEALDDLLARIELADRVGLDVFGIGEHHRREFLDSAPAVILAAAAARTERIRLTSAVTVLSAADPVRVFQQFATLDLISKGRAEIVAGRGSFSEAFPLFGLSLYDYDDLFAEKLRLLLEIRELEVVSWRGQFRPPLEDQSIYPRPIQDPLPIWLGVGGTPASFVRAGELGLPLMVAVIGGETKRMRPLVDLYREAGERAGHAPETLRVGVHSLGFVAPGADEAVERYFPGYAETFTRIGEERGWPPVTRAGYDAQVGPEGALVVGDPAEVAEKILRHSEALGGISRFTFQMDNAGLPQSEVLRAIELIGREVAPRVKG
ncbi:MAG: Atu2307/SP_0267 family LLM class monooxygenase [Acidobacteriota bacterium]